MTPVVDIIGYVVTAMKPVISALTYTVSRGGVRFATTDRGILRRVFIGEKIRVTGSDGIVYYGSITSVTQWSSFEADFPSLPTNISTLTAAALIINYHYGHPLEITNMIRQKVQNENYNREVFPMVCLFQDFKETFKEAHEWEAELNVVIVTDTRPEYEASQRYTYSFTPMLYPLYELFLQELAASKYIQNTHFDHVKYDRLYWGKSGIYGNVANIFNDFIDAIELENLRVKILKSC